MRVLAGLWAAVCLTVSLGGAAHAADLAAYGRLPTIEDIDLSPDGKLLALIRTDGEKRQIAVEDLASHKIIALVDGGSRKVRYLEWADNDNLIIVSTVTSNLQGSGVRAARGDYAIGAVLNVTGRSVQSLLGKRADQTLNVIEGVPIPRIENGHTTVYVVGETFNNQGQGVATVFRVELPSGQTQTLYQGRPESSDYLISDDGHIFAEGLYQDKGAISGLMIRNGQSLRATTLPKDFVSSLDLIGRSADGHSALVRYRTETESILSEVSPEGVWTPLKDSEGDAAIIDRYTGHLMGLVGHGGDAWTYQFNSPQDQRAWKAIQAAFPGEIVTLAGYSADHKRILVQSDSPTEGPAYAVVDMTTGKADFVGGVYSGLKPADVSPVHALAFKAADGLDLTGYLTVPKTAGANAKNLPLVVLAHGGPADRDDLGFDWWSQALAAQGYAVLRVNFRGSSGYGVSFMEAGFGQWGKKMQTDLSDGVRYLAGQGLIDPKRVCIVGASYGGYAALAGATLDRGVYRCAASVAGPADLSQMLQVARDDHGQTTLLYWNKFMGVSGVKDPNLAAISPAAHAGDVEIPILLIHGKDDTVVEYKQSQIMADALKKAGKPYEFVTLDGEDHWLSNGVTRLKMLQSVTAFLQKNNPPN